MAGEKRQGRTECAPVQVPAPDQEECQAAERTRRMPASERLANARSATPTHTARARATRIVPRHSPALVSSMAPSPRHGIRHTDESGLVSWRVPDPRQGMRSLQSVRTPLSLYRPPTWRGASSVRVIVDAETAIDGCRRGPLFCLPARVNGCNVYLGMSGTAMTNAARAASSRYVGCTRHRCAQVRHEHAFRQH